MTLPRFGTAEIVAWPITAAIVQTALLFALGQHMWWVCGLIALVVSLVLVLGVSGLWRRTRLLGVSGLWRRI